MDPTLPNQTLHCTLVTTTKTKLSLNHQEKLNMRLQISPERLMPNDQNVVQEQPPKHQFETVLQEYIGLV